MKTLRKFTAPINMIIFIILTIVGTLLGSALGQMRIGMLLGMASGLIGITGFYYYMGLTSLKAGRESIKAGMANNEQ